MSRYHAHCIGTPALPSWYMATPWVMFSFHHHYFSPLSIYTLHAFHPFYLSLAYILFRADLKTLLATVRVWCTTMKTTNIAMPDAERVPKIKSAILIPWNIAATWQRLLPDDDAYDDDAAERISLPSFSPLDSFSPEKPYEAPQHMHHTWTSPWHLGKQPRANFRLTLIDPQRYWSTSGPDEEKNCFVVATGVIYELGEYFDQLFNEINLACCKNLHRR